MPGDDGRGQAHGDGGRLGESSECREGGEGLVSAAREHHGPHDLGPGLLRRADLGLEPLQVGGVARERDDPLEVHRRGLGPVAEGVGLGLVAGAEADLDAAGAERPGVVEESDRLGEPVLGASVAVAGAAHGERVDDQPEGIAAIGRAASRSPGAGTAARAPARRWRASRVGSVA